MGVLSRFERRIDRLVNGTFARAFKSEVQPVEIASALTRECDDKAAIVARGRTMVPNTFRVELGPHDHERLAMYLDPLSDELAEMVEEHADEQGYSFVGPVTVGFAREQELETGVFRIRSSAVSGPRPASSRSSRSQPEPAVEVVRITAPAASDGVGYPATRGHADARHAPWLDLGDGTYALTRQVTVIGRGAEADLRLEDLGVSRRHARIERSPEHTVITDLGSTNGILVDGERVDTAVLTDGTAIVLGATRVVFRESSPGRDR